MSDRLIQLADQVRTLGTADQVHLLDTLLDCLEEPPSPDIAAEWSQEIERRVAAHARGESETDSAEQVFEEARRIAP